MDVSVKLPGQDQPIPLQLGPLTLLTRAEDGGESPIVEALERELSVVEQVTYLAASGRGPRDAYPLGGPTQHQTVGRHGELAPGLVYWFGAHEVLPDLRLPGETGTTSPLLGPQTAAWLGHLIPGAGFEVQPVRGTELITLGLRSDPASPFRLPQNVSAGIVHLFPVVVALLRARTGDVLLLDHPEVYLAGPTQSKLGELLARAAACGVQVVVETHSDHVLNGVRRAVQARVIDADRVAIHYLPNPAEVVSLTIDQAGNIEPWPGGFFDQIDRDMAILGGM